MPEAKQTSEIGLLDVTCRHETPDNLCSHHWINCPHSRIGIGPHRTWRDDGVRKSWGMAEGPQAEGMLRRRLWGWLLSGTSCLPSCCPKENLPGSPIVALQSSPQAQCQSVQIDITFLSGALEKEVLLDFCCIKHDDAFRSESPEVSPQVRGFLVPSTGQVSIKAGQVFLHGDRICSNVHAQDGCKKWSICVMLLCTRLS